GLRWLSNYRQCYGGGAVTAARGRKPIRFSTGHYVSISRLTPKTIGWRHLAMVFDAERRTLSVWLDHWQCHTHRMQPETIPDSLHLWIHGGFDGLIDTVRVVDRALGPESFLRASQEQLKDISFEHEDRVFPSDAGQLSVKRHFGAVGNGVVDDTAAIQKAFRETANHQASGSTYVLHFPAGTYLVSDTIKWSRFLRVQGEGPESTKIVLRDHCAGFQDSENPKPVVAASAVPGKPGSNRAVNGSTIANWFHGFTVDTGRGNGGAIGVEYHSNNYGSLENVLIRSGDGSGVIGLDLTHKTNGPTLIANTHINGFDLGIKTRHLEYSVTMEDLELENQNVVGIDNGGNILAMHRITSHNSVPVIRSPGGFGMVTLMNCDFSGGSSDQTAMELGGGCYLRDIDVSDYGTSLVKTINTWNPNRQPNFTRQDAATLVGKIDEFIGDQQIGTSQRPSDAPTLTIKDPPSIPIGNLETDWQNVQEFAELVVQEGKHSDWSFAIEAAFATGKPTIYFPRGGNYTVSRPVSVPTSVRRLYGMDNGLRTLGQIRQKNLDYPNLQGNLIISDDTEEPLLIEFLSASIDHRSNRDVILQHAGFDYRATENAGNVFLRDAAGPWWSFAPGQRVWARQWNVESHEERFPCITTDATHLWSLGFKTEYQSQKLRATNGSKVEIY
ncbi:MAG: glycosyl hydrolase family 28-related protein, partial [Planctomycetota bacterium]